MAKRAKGATVTTTRFYSRELRSHLRNASRFMVKKLAQEIRIAAQGIVRVKTGDLKDSLKEGARKVRGEDYFEGTVRSGANKRGFRYGYIQEIGRPSGNYSFTPYLRPAHALAMQNAPEILKAAAAEEATKQATKRGRPKKTPTP